VLDLPSLQQIVDVLNGDKHLKTTALLRAMVQSWKEAGWDVDKLCKSNPYLPEMLQKLWSVMYLPSPQGGAKLLPMFIGPVAVSAVSHAHELFKDGPVKDLIKVAADDPLILAIQYFGALTVQEWEKLGGPCARCNATTSNGAPHKRFIAPVIVGIPLPRWSEPQNSENATGEPRSRWQRRRSNNGNMRVKGLTGKSLSQRRPELHRNG
jgi:hypothetical protein